MNRKNVYRMNWVGHTLEEIAEAEGTSTYRVMLALQDEDAGRCCCDECGPFFEALDAHRKAAQELGVEPDSHEQFALRYDEMMEALDKLN